MRSCPQPLLTILLVALLLALSFSIRTVGSSNGNWWNADWIYRRAINITENSGYSLTDFPIEVVFRHDGHVQSDGRDIRIVDDGVELPYYIESLNSTWTTVMFEINLTALSSKSLYVYYGNPNTTAPNYPLVPLTIIEGNNGHAIIDNSVYLGWAYTSWGWSNNVELWNDFRIDFNGNGNLADDNDLIKDYGSRQGGIGRQRVDTQAIGLGNYHGYVETPIYVDIDFADAKLRVYKNHPWVETAQADFLHMFSPSWDYGNYGLGSEQNIVDGLNVTQITPSPPWHYPWNERYISPVNPNWMAYRDSITREVFGSIGSNIGTQYDYYFAAKEGSDWDRCVFHDFVAPNPPLELHDQPSDCRIYWYADNSNGYSEIHKTAAILNNPPTASVLSEETSENHDVAVTSILPSQPAISQGSSASINATVTNQGNYTETFNVRIYARNNSAPLINTSGLVGYWKFDEGDGTTVHDSSGNNNNGLLWNNPVWTEGKYGTALSFDGIDDCVVIPYSSSLDFRGVQPFTLEAWIKPTAPPQGLHGACIVDKYSNYGLLYDHDQPQFRSVLFRSSGVWYSAGQVSITPTVWHHFVGVYDPPYLRAYVDGVEVANNNVGNLALDPNAGSVAIGASQLLESWFHGAIDEVMIFNRALTVEEIGSQYQEKALVQNQIVTLPSGNSTTVTLTWNTVGFGMGNYTIEAYAEPVLGEVDTTDNTMTYSPVEIIPEFPSAIVLLPLMIFVMLAIITTKKSHCKRASG